MRAFGHAAVALGHPGAFVQPFAGGLAVSGGPASPIPELVLGAALPTASTAPPPPADVAIANAPDLAEWTRVSVDGFSASEAPEGRDAAAEVHGREAIARAAELLARGHVQRCLATRAGVPAGAASLRVAEDGIAQCCGATTLIEHRRRGIQTALLYHRLAAATASGCSLAVVITEPGSRSRPPPSGMASRRCTRVSSSRARNVLHSFFPFFLLSFLA